MSLYELPYPTGHELSTGELFAWFVGTTLAVFLVLAGGVLMAARSYNAKQKHHH